MMATNQLTFIRQTSFLMKNKEKNQVRLCAVDLANLEGMNFSISGSKGLL